MFLKGNRDINNFIFCHHFQIAKHKFMEFIRDQNATENFQNYINESKNLSNLKVSSNIFYYREILLTFMKFC